MMRWNVRLNIWWCRYYATESLNYELRMAFELNRMIEITWKATRPRRNGGKRFVAYLSPQLWQGSRIEVFRFMPNWITIYYLIFSFHHFHNWDIYVCFEGNQIVIINCYFTTFNSSSFTISDFSRHHYDSTLNIIYSFQFTLVFEHIYLLLKRNRMKPLIKWS